MQHTDKMHQESFYFFFFGGGGIFGTVYSRIAGASGGLGLWTHWGTYSASPPDNHLLQVMTYDHCISCLRQDTTFINALTTNFAHHSKFLKKDLGANVLIWGRRNFLGLKFRDPSCAICSLKFAVDKIIWGLIFLVCHCPSHFLSWF